MRDQYNNSQGSGGKIPADLNKRSGGKIPVDLNNESGGKITTIRPGRTWAAKLKKFGRMVILVLAVLGFITIASYGITLMKSLFSRNSDPFNVESESISSAVPPFAFLPTSTPIPTKALPSSTHKQTSTKTPTKIPPTSTPKPTATKTPTRIPPTSTPAVSIPASLVPGSYFYFGHYEQDNNYYNGQEPIQWRVLSVNYNYALVISQYVLDARPYHSIRTNVTWGTSDIRSWLNNSFYYTAFTWEERNYIAESSVYTSDNRKTSGKDGNTTRDHIFLLDYDEAIRYFSSDYDRQAAPTAYARANRAYVSSNTRASWWWLRWPGQDNRWAANVGASGGVYPNGTEVNYNGENGTGGIRPVFWIRFR